MGMLLTCSNKGCGTQDYHKLDKESNEVFCVSCGKSVEVTKYVKTVLLAQGQIMRKQKSSMESQCPSCGSLDGPVLLKYSKTLFKVGCKKCLEVNVHLTKYFLGAMRMKSDIETVDMSKVKPEAEVEEAITKTLEGAVIVNKPFTAPTKPAPRKGPNPNVKTAAPTPKPKIPSVTFTEAIDDFEDDEGAGFSERPKIEVSKKSSADANNTEAALRRKFVDPATGDVSEELKATLKINKI